MKRFVKRVSPALLGTFLLLFSLTSCSFFTWKSSWSGTAGGDYEPTLSAAVDSLVAEIDGGNLLNLSMNPKPFSDFMTALANTEFFFSGSVSSYSQGTGYGTLRCGNTSVDFEFLNGHEESLRLFEHISLQGNLHLGTLDGNGMSFSLSPCLRGNSPPQNRGINREYQSDTGSLLSWLAEYFDENDHRIHTSPETADGLVRYVLSMDILLSGVVTQVHEDYACSISIEGEEIYVALDGNISPEERALVRQGKPLTVMGKVLSLNRYGYPSGSFSLHHGVPVSNTTL